MGLRMSGTPHHRDPPLVLSHILAGGSPRRPVIFIYSFTILRPKGSIQRSPAPQAWVGLPKHFPRAEGPIQGFELSSSRCCVSDFQPSNSFACLIPGPPRPHACSSTQAVMFRPFGPWSLANQCRGLESAVNMEITIPAANPPGVIMFAPRLSSDSVIETSICKDTPEILLAYL